MKLWDRITLLWAYWFAPRFIGVDWGSYDEDACVIWFKHKDKIYMTDYISRESVVIENSQEAHNAND